MQFFNSLLQKFNQWNEKPFDKTLNITGPSPSQWCFLYKNLLAQENSLLSQKNHLVVLPSADLAENFYENCKKFNPSFYIDYFPGLETNPYTKILSSEKDLYKRFSLLDHSLVSEKKTILVCTLEAFFLKVPPPNFFNDLRIELKCSDIISPYDLSTKLVSLGYQHATSTEEPGTFCQKGEIFDIFPISDYAIRIQYYDDMIEEIHHIDIQTQKTIRKSSIDHIFIGPTPQALLQKRFHSQLRENISMPDASQREKFETRKRIFSHLSSNQLFENYPVFLPLFFKETSTILNYFKKEDTVITFIEKEKSFQSILEYQEELRENFEEVSQDQDNDIVLSHPDTLYNFEESDSFQNLTYSIETNEVSITKELDFSLEHSILFSFESSKQFITRHIGPYKERRDYISKLFKFLNSFLIKEGKILFCYKNNESLKEFQFFIDQTNLEKNESLTYVKNKIDEGFFYQAERTLVLSDADIFGSKKKKIKNISKKSIDLFAEQISTLKSGDYIIHSKHGVGQYLGLESINMAGNESDYLVLKYAQNDKVYVPVYKMNLIQKHADSASQTKVANLRNNKFIQLKSKAKKAAKELAFDLLELQAKRKLTQAYSFSQPDHHFKEFELAFPFDETPDQLNAIENVLSEMQKDSPMDYLVCGDVGFGKTEVAMRASFKAVLDGKQVAILVPTTILAFQHYNSFIQRFKKFPVNIELLSRFKSPKETKEIKEDLKCGKVDILIGTHKLLSDSVIYKDLGLVIVDEEQRFGVGHKEKLKLLKTSVDFLTLTATPIPRTLQLAFLGLKDLSLIQTAPPKRQSIKTYLVKEDKKTLKKAIEKELKRGGQVFIVHNRVSDIELYAAKIKELVPESNIVFAHGQMKESELEKKMKDFYMGKFDILISTTIIESGIDIPNANTIIIDRADTFGLSQLHQLRGRIGRSDRKAYAYFIIPNQKILSPVATRRLKALQTYADMGSGFSIASSDLEIRGAGDILGGNQSGHVEAVGLELYMELLKEAVNELKGEKVSHNTDLEVTTQFPSFIPKSYIKDDAERLKQYKRLSNCGSLDILESNKEVLIDIYGSFPQEVKNLFLVLECRLILKNLAMTSFKITAKNILISFDENIINSNESLRNRIVSFFMERPKVYQFSPNYQVNCSFKDKLSQENILEFAKLLSNKILPID